MVNMRLSTAPMSILSEGFPTGRQTGLPSGGVHRKHGHP
ncbi:hypothetical protein D3OALGA1CA_3846 [Olavius algarvensis associated proteobacterium Delta 3]|nr:hypothetical protein D3OALGA1CA_3846 [Olavius algarvensis associated proteobacterium Delta 3]